MPTPLSSSRGSTPARWVAAAALVLLAGCATPQTELAPTASTLPPVPSAPAPSTGPDAATPPETSVTPETPETSEQAVPEARTSEAQAALAQLATLPVKGRAPKTGYDRALFGQRWSDDVNVAGGRNGCDTRNDILRRDLVEVEFKAGTRDCVVLSGTLHDAYTGTVVAFTRGQDTSAAVQIDHVVALSDAWQKGAQQLDEQTRADFANDPRNLQAVDGPTNQRKGDGDAATWLPPNRSYRCTYVARQVQVKAAYGLWVTPAEHEAITRVLTGCGASAPADGVAPAVAPSAVPSTALFPTEAPTTAPQPAAPIAPADTSVHYPNCAAARAAGAAPLYAGEPGYRTGLDRDGDGIACE